MSLVTPPAAYTTRSGWVIFTPATVGPGAAASVADRLRDAAALAAREGKPRGNVFFTGCNLPEASPAAAQRGPRQPFYEHRGQSDRGQLPDAPQQSLEQPPSIALPANVSEPTVSPPL